MDIQNEAPKDVLGRLPEFACSHWTGYGIESELCHNYLHAISALRAIRNAEWMMSHNWGGDRAAILAQVDKALAKSEEK